MKQKRMRGNWRVALLIAALALLSLWGVSGCSRRTVWTIYVSGVSRLKIEGENERTVKAVEALNKSGKSLAEQVDAKGKTYDEILDLLMPALQRESAEQITIDVISEDKTWENGAVAEISEQFGDLGEDGTIPVEVRKIRDLAEAQQAMATGTDIEEDGQSEENGETLSEDGNQEDGDGAAGEDAEGTSGEGENAGSAESGESEGESSEGEGLTETSPETAAEEASGAAAEATAPARAAATEAPTRPAATTAPTRPAATTAPATAPNPTTAAAEADGASREAPVTEEAPEAETEAAEPAPEEAQEETEPEMTQADQAEEADGSDTGSVVIQREESETEKFVPVDSDKESYGPGWN